MISLRKITEDNFEEVIALDAGDNDKFVERNIYSIAEAKILPEYIIESIYNDETLVGFVMYKFENPNNGMYINRFMIDHKFHNNGFGTSAMKLLLDMAKEKGFETIRLHANLENTNAMHFYKKFGFIDTGRMQEEENEFELKL